MMRPSSKSHFGASTISSFARGGGGGGGVLDIFLGAEVRRGPSYPDPV